MEKIYINYGKITGVNDTFQLAMYDNENFDADYMLTLIFQDKERPQIMFNSESIMDDDKFRMISDFLDALHMAAASEGKLPMNRVETIARALGYREYANNF